MRRTLSRVLAGASVLLAVLLYAPLLAHADEASGVEMQNESWYFRYGSPLAPAPDQAPVQDPSGNAAHTAPGIAKASARDQARGFYAGEFLRVGINAGEEEARSYVSFPLFELGDGAPIIVNGGTLTLVAAPGTGDNAADKQRNVDGADMVGCAIAEFFVASELGGDWEVKPAIRDDVCSPAVRSEGTERPTWTIDLAPFASLWADPLQNFGVAILANPASEASAPQQSWNVAFPTKFNLGGPPVLADLEFTVQELPDFSFDGGEDFSASSGDFSSGGGSFSSPSGGFDSGGDFSSGDTSFEPPPVDAPAVDLDSGEPAIQAQPEGPSTAPVNAGLDDIRTNPAVYLLPFLGLGLAGLLGYSLSHDPELPAKREGAVSKLMNRRRTGLS